MGMSLYDVLERLGREWKALIRESKTAIGGNRIWLDARSSSRVEGRERTSSSQEEGEEVDRMDEKAKIVARHRWKPRVPGTDIPDAPEIITKGKDSRFKAVTGIIVSLQALDMYLLVGRTCRIRPRAGVNREGAGPSRRLVRLDPHGPQDRQRRGSRSVLSVNKDTLEDNRPAIVGVGVESQGETRCTAGTPSSL